MKRGCELLGITERRDLACGMDFRKPEFRREVFLRFYEFHLKHRAHPGCVYSILPFLFEKLKMDEEQRLWFCFINGNTQNPVTSMVIYDKFNRPSECGNNFSPVGDLEAWFIWYNENLQFDTDRRHWKFSFAESVDYYIKAVKSPEDLKRGVESSFGEAFQWVYDNYYGFGRLSTFSYLEYLKIAGVKVECDDLMIEDIDGSRSHRNGLCRVLGREDLDWHKSNPAFDGKYSAEVLAWLKSEAEILLLEAKARFKGRDFERDVSYFTLESTLCTYKSWHRPNRRYPGVYLDMFNDRIGFHKKRLSKNQAILDLFQEWRDTVPKKLKTECNPGDLGLHKIKQNHYLGTGEVIMMDDEWPCFRNAYNDKVSNHKEQGPMI